MPAGQNEKKKTVPVVIYTATHRIEGFYHASDNGGRLLDDLNEQARDFIPLTDVRVSKLAAGEGQLLTVAKFLAVNRQTIMLFFPNPKVVLEGARAEQSASGAAPAAGPRLVNSSYVPGLVVGRDDD